MPGRRPTPTKLKLLRGTTRADRARVGEPEPPEGKIVRPEFLKYRSKELWDENVDMLTQMGTLTVADVSIFATWCVLMAEFEDKKSDMQASQIAQMRLLAADLGMGASARAKLGTGKKKKKDPADEFFNKTG